MDVANTLHNECGRWSKRVSGANGEDVLVKNTHKPLNLIGPHNTAPPLFGPVPPGALQLL
jgi:hypothetical protein